MSGLSPARLLVLAVVCVALGCSRDNPDYFDDPRGEVGPPDGGPEGGAPADAVVDVAVDSEPVDSEPVDSGAAVVDGAPVDAGVDRGVMGDAGGDAGVVDEDGDGVPAGLDCDDGDGAVFPGAVERCDGRDEDCDEAVDEGVAGCCVAGAVQVCGRDVGACRAGAQRCGDDGAFGACAGAVGPGVEGCDGVDEDCDGVVDEGFGVGAACVVGEGACAVMGVVVCGAGAAVCDAAPGAPGVERCDGVDEDCDGAVDEGFGVGGVCLAGEGVCAREGVVGCMDGEAVCDAVPGEPGVELCNGLDEDCDGVTDEGAGGGMACDAGRGACRRSGQVVCDDRGERICDVVAGPPGVERCNRIDDDCDGPTDEDWPTLGQRCVVEAGGCASRGVFACAADGAGVFCDAAPIAGVDERCNGGDDDCDGRVDEGIGLGEACEAGVGACARAGVRVCGAAGAVVCDAAPGAAGAETCDGVDEDCDGAVDEGFALGAACAVGVGACARDGVLVCRGGGAVCDAVAAAGGDEVCNAVDDDCDGAVDEGALNACGECGAVPAEVCNGRDEDCDGQVDEGGDVCVLFVASRAAPAGAVGFGSVIAAAGDLDGDGIGDAVVGAPAGEVGVAAIVSGADGGVLWSVPGAATFGAAVAAARQGGAPAVFVGQPGGDNGVVVQLDAAGGEVARWPGSDDFRAGRQLVAIDDAPWFAMADRDAMATFFGPAGGVRLVPIGGDGVAVTVNGEGGQAMGERLFAGPDRGGDGLPDLYATARSVDRVLVPWIDPPAALGPPIAAPALTAGSFGEALSAGRLLPGDEAAYLAIGAPLLNGQNGGVYVYTLAGAPVGSPLQNGGRSARQGHRIEVLPRPGADRDALIVGAERMTELRVWTLIRAVDGRPVIATSLPVRVDGAQSGFGSALALSAPAADGTRRLFVGEPTGGNGGRVHVFRVR